ncbi:hypothetical protein DFQ28_001414 [Apophysomyces sp. BC1034]|nr:hypothetical protein DFQ28_001414 [Apophysomyces sp. BC1034]
MDDGSVDQKQSNHSQSINLRNPSAILARKNFRTSVTSETRSSYVAANKYYAWEPEGCVLLPFDPPSFAEHLNEHPLLLVGDSITQLQYESLHCLLGEHLTTTKPGVNVTGGDTKIKVNQLSYGDNNDSPAVAYLRSDYLLRLDDFKMISPFEDEGDQLGKGHNFPWVHALPMFDYIVINTGPHWHPNLKWGPNQSESELKEAFKRSMRIDWIREENDDRFAFLDVALSNLRGDSHSRPGRDCLHTCLPGPVDDWNRLIHHEITRQLSNERL